VEQYIFSVWETCCKTEGRLSLIFLVSRFSIKWFSFELSEMLPGAPKLSVEKNLFRLLPL
jgi:hypothetical protein